jgi:undecaprenyl-diphosphatase
VFAALDQLEIAPLVVTGIFSALVALIVLPLIIALARLPPQTGQDHAVTAPPTSTAAAADRAGARLLLAVLGGLTVAVAAVPLAVLVRSEYAPVVRLDVRTSAAAEAAVSGSAPLLALARAVTLLGEPVLMTVAAAALVVALAARGRSRLALYVLLARVGALVLSSGLKLAVDRSRPVFDEPVATALGASFPSGHALGSAAFWVTTAVLLVPRTRHPRLLLGAAVAVAVAVAASRVLLGVHYLSDVTGGLLLGLGWAALLTAVFTAWRADEGRPVDPVQQGVDP